jgi:hypothetical protein
LEQGIDFTQFNFQKLMPEANHIVYYGLWQKPTNGDAWTEGLISSWGHDANLTLTSEGSIVQVGAKSLRAEIPSGGSGDFYWPSGKNAAWDFTKISTNTNIPHIKFYYRYHGSSMAGTFGFHTDSTHYSFVDLWSLAPNPDTWYHLDFPFGPYWDKDADVGMFVWSKGTTDYADWANVNYINFGLSAAPGNYEYVDGLFMAALVCRIAKNSTNIGTYGLRSKLIKDDVGKDDTLTPTDTGLMAQMAKAELLRCQTAPIVGTVTVKMIKDLLPGQLLHIHANKKPDGSFYIDKDMRVTRVTQKFSPFESTINLTDDKVNANAREAFTSMNTFLKAIRPDYQDRQAASIKVGSLDITVPRIEMDYPS